MDGGSDGEKKMEAVIVIVVGTLFPLLMGNILRLRLPNECYIWLNSKYPLGMRLLSVAISIPVLGWALLAVSTIWYHPVDQADALGIWAFILVPPVLLVLAKILLKIFWKPTPEMLAHNDRAVARELEQMRKKLAQRGSQPPEESEQEIRRYWQCPNCGSKNDESEKACLRCGRAAALWGDQPVYFNEVEE